MITVVLTALTLLVVCAIGLGWSAVAARTSSSSVLTYLPVAFLTLGLPILFGLSLATVRQDDVVVVRSPVYSGQDDANFRCRQQHEVQTRTHSERTWWLQAPSPYVVVADASPTDGGADDPLILIRESVREARLGALDNLTYCDSQTPEELQARANQRDDLPAAWPWGLAAHVAVMAGFVTITIRRLRSPSRRLPRGSRVA